MMQPSIHDNRFATHLFFLLFILVISLIFCLQTAFAVNLEACKRYAAESVRQNEQNISLNAGFTGPAWSSNFNHHYNWCIQGNNLASTPMHLANREKALQEYAIKSAKEQFKRYATESVRQHNESNAMGAGFAPPVWSPDFNSHYNWCRQGNNISTTPGHLANREKALQEYAILHNKGPVQKMQRITMTEIVGKTILPGNGKPAIIAAKPDKINIMLVKRDKLRHSIDTLNGGKLEVTSSTSFSIPKGVLEVKHLIDIPEIGLYKIHINLGKTAPHVSVSPRIDAEGYSYQLQSPKSLKSLTPTLNTTIFQKPAQNTDKFQKTASGSYVPWIVSDSSISTIASIPSDYYFWVDKEHLPSNGKLQFRLQVTQIEKNSSKGSKGEIGESGYIASTPAQLIDHAHVTGNFNVVYTVPYKATFKDQFNIKGSAVPYSILTLPSVMQSGMAFSVIETPVLDLSNDQNMQGSPPALSFFLANAERLSSQDGQLNDAADNPGGITAVKNPNAWIYKDILTKEYGQIKDCNSIALDGTSICSREKRVRYYSWDMPAKGYNGSLLLDVIEPPLGSYSVVVTNNPIDARVTSLEIFTTRGWLIGSGLHSGDDLRNEMVVAARNSAPIKWTYVAELSKIAVSDQAEYEDDDADDGFGEFSLLTTSILTEPMGENQIAVGPDQIVSRSMPFPMIDNEDRPHNFCIRPLGNKGRDPVNNAGATTYPKVPIFVMDYDKLKTYDSLLLNVLMTEHDEKTFWQENGAVVTAFFNFCKGVGGMVKGGFSPEAFAKTIYSFASTQLNSNTQVDDFMGNAAISVFKKDNFGLLGKNKIIYTLEGPADSNCFDMTYSAANDGRASVSSAAPKCSNSRQISATIKLRRIQQLDSWADIQLVNYTPVDSVVPEELIQQWTIDKRRDQYLREGLLSNSHSSYQITVLKDAKAGNAVAVRAPQQQPSASSALNKGVIRGSEWKRGQQTMNSQRWDGKGFTYYQAELDDIVGNFPRFPAATISFTLYHEDVIKYAGEKDFHWFDADGSRSTIGLKSVKIPNSDFYKVDIKLLDSGDWLQEANLVAYVHVN
ncbi:MAG: hypothetical protein KKE44_20055 [Proteobacteria bacterium]|nr:hypothetical protein [Pseudomonadota bacterium]MBU1585026.1 hypothetical protein [Pseudomonadota bacterium]MBU2629031.1 hypothetical protein [Pseudomonadota bacterium]